MVMINTDNETGLQLSPLQRMIAKAAIEDGEIMDCAGGCTIWEDVVDMDGNLCLDEKEFEQVKKVISKVGSVCRNK